MEARKNILVLALSSVVGIGGLLPPDATAALTQIICPVTSVGWRENIKALRVICGKKIFWNRISSTCTQKSSMDTIKLFQATANASLLSGKSVQMYYTTQGGCNSKDPVIREMYLLK